MTACGDHLSGEVIECYFTYALFCCFVLFLVFSYSFLISMINSCFDKLEKLMERMFLPVVFCYTVRKTVRFFRERGLGGKTARQSYFIFLPGSLTCLLRIKEQLSMVCLL